MDWKNYEREVFETLQLYYPAAKIIKDYKQVGVYSKRERQVDIYIEETIGGITTTVYVECKYYQSNIDVKTVESFISMAADLNADIGIMITEKGYSEAALNRAYYNPEEIQLDILSLGELKELQGHMAFPHSGNYGVALLSPFGWVIDANRRKGVICTLYQKGLSFEEAALRKEIAYINYWDRLKKGETIEDLITLQENGIRKNAEHYSLKVNEISYSQGPNRKDGQTIIRKVDIDRYPGIELTGFIEFKEFIFFCTWFSNPINIKRNLRKLSTMLKMVLPLEFQDVQILKQIQEK